MNKYTKVLLPMVYVGVLLFMVMSSMLIIKGVQNYLKEDVTYKYALDGVFDGDIMPVMKTESNSIIRPYLNESVKVGKYFYDYESDDKKQTESIIFYENTYMQNTGVNYINDESFDVVSVLDGEVIGVEDSEIYGKVLTIKHNDNFITTYSNIENVSLQVGYKVSQGEILGSSIVSDISDGKFMLHFEAVHKGSYIDPENLYTLKVSEIQ